MRKIENCRKYIDWVFENMKEDNNISFEGNPYLRMEWGNVHEVGKLLICKSREENATRLFIQDVTNLGDNIKKKEGWWNTFTLSNKPINQGLWLCKVVKYKLDRNHFLNLIVEPLQPIDYVKYHTFFETKNGTWNSIAFYYMINKSELFLDEYNFPHYSINTPNEEMLFEKFPNLKGLSYKDMGMEMLNMYLTNKATLKDFEDALNTLNEEDSLANILWTIAIQENAPIEIQKKYPTLVRKTIARKKSFSALYGLSDIHLFIIDQVNNYNKLLNEGLIQKETTLISCVEASLAYEQKKYDALKEARKVEKKANRLAKKNKKNI